jgi:hypothetical protein
MPDPSAVTSSMSRWTVTCVSNMTPRSRWYSSRPASICSVARGSRSRLRTFWDLAYVHAQIRPSRTTYQSGMRCGKPRGPIVAQVTMRSSSRNARTSASDMVIWSRRLTGEAG